MKLRLKYLPAPIRLRRVAALLARRIAAPARARAPVAPAPIVALGDSITRGQGAPPGQDWPDHLSRLLGMRVANRGIDGAPVARGTASMVDRFRSDVLATPGVRVLILWGGINDMQEGADASQVIGGLREIATRAHAAGLRVVGLTVTPNGCSSHFRDAQVPVRAAVNAWIRATRVYDAVVDADALLRDPAQPQWLARRHDSGDGLHPNVAAYALIARSLAPLIASPDGH
jgi:lysophospholipase L1-like esterase